MSSPHMNLAANGIRFGEVVVTVDLDLRDAEIRAPRPGTFGQGAREIRFNSLDEITGAYAQMIGQGILDLGAPPPRRRDRNTRAAPRCGCGRMTEQEGTSAAPRRAPESARGRLRAAQRCSGKRTDRQGTIAMPLRHIHSATPRPDPNPMRAASRIFQILDMGKKALPKNLVERDDGSILVNQALSDVAAVSDALPLSSEISTLIDADGRLILDPPGKSAGASVRIDAAIAECSRAVGAGAHLIVVDPNVEPVPLRGGVAFQTQHARFAVVEAAAFEAVGLEADPNAEVSVSPRPVSEVEIDPEDFTSYAFAFKLSRRELKDTPPEHLAGELLWPVALGLGRLSDAAIFTELAAQSANPWALGKAAAAGVPFGELRALVGTGGTGAQAAEGGLFVDGIPAELTADTAQTYVGAFSRAAIAIDPDINLLLKRTSAAGDLEVTCWVDMKAFLADATKFWNV